MTHRGLSEGINLPTCPKCGDYADALAVVCASCGEGIYAQRWTVNRRLKLGARPARARGLGSKP